MERKHRKQMSHTEIRVIESTIHKLDGWDLATHHILEQMEKRGVTKQDILDTLKLGEVIEVNSRGRVVLRLRIKLRPDMKRGTVVVVNPREKVLVTAWHNDERDHHATLDMNEYHWQVNAAEFLQAQIQTGAN